jgi:TolB-like protein/Tfp pilus assembly protein PilF
MASIIPGYEYDIFISYRQKDNKGDKWVSSFVDALKTELEATFKEDISVYFDENPHDRLQETHNVGKSLEGKLKCLIFVPILSQTYCDPSSYAWQYEFIAFNKIANEDRLGRDVKLRSGNVSGRILPIRIHDLEQEDINQFEKETGSVLRAIDFIFKTTTGVSRPLLSDEDHPNDNLNKTFYRDQINKVTHAIKEIVLGMKTEYVSVTNGKNQSKVSLDESVTNGKRSEITKPDIPVKNKLLSTLTIIAVLIITVILLYPIIFKRDKLEGIRNVDGKISIAVMPFENLTGDTTLNWFERGISSLIINGLGSSAELAVSDDQTMFEVIQSMDKVFTAGISPSQAKEVAEKLKAETYISGSFQGTEGKYRVLTNLVNTKSGDIIYTNKVEGNLKSSGYLDMMDSLCNEIKNFLELKALEQKADYDFREAYPESAEAYRYFIDGANLISKSDYESAIKLLKKAVEIDSSFTFASFYLAFAYDYNNQVEEGRMWIQKAYSTKDRLPLKYQNWLELWYACFVSKNQQDIIQYCNLLEKSGIESRLLWFDLGVTYYNFADMYDKAINAFERVADISMERGGDWNNDRYYTEYCQVLMLANEPLEVQKISNIGLQVNPENTWMSLYKGSSYVMLGDTLAVENSISELRSIAKKYNLSKSTEEWAIGLMYLRAKDTLMTERHYRKAYNLNPENLARINNLAEILIRSGINISEGLKLSEQGIKKFPESIFLQWIKAVALHKSGRNDEALAILREVDQNFIGYNKVLTKDMKEVELAIANQK